MNKRLFAILSVLVMLMSVIAPSALAEGEYKSGAELYKEGITEYKYQAGEIMKYDEPVTLTSGRAIDFNASAFVKMAENGEPVTNNRWIQLYRDKVNVNVEYGLDNASGSDYGQQLLLAMTTGELPDVFLIGDLSMLNQMAEAHYQLDHLCVVIDRNRLQISGSTENVMAHDSQEARWTAFGWHVISIDGSSIEAIDAAFAQAKAVKDKPTVIIANTIKGYGSPLMEHKASWHHHLPDQEEYEQIMADFALRKEAVRCG